MKMNLNKDGKKRIHFIIRELDKTQNEVNKISASVQIDEDDQYQRINRAYFQLFQTHYLSFKLLMKEDHFSSAVVVARTMLEIYVRCFYLEFIEQPKGTDVEMLITQPKDFASFFQMSTALDNFEDPDNGDFHKHFKQFTKQCKALYEKYSTFTHGRGELLNVLFKGKQPVCAYEDIESILLTLNGMLQVFAMQFLHMNANEALKKRLLDRMLKTEETFLNHGIGQPDYYSNLTSW